MAQILDEVLAGKSRLDLFLRLIFHSLLTALILVVTYVGAYTSIDVRNYVEVFSISGEQVFFEDEEISFDVDSVVKRNFAGGYMVSFRSREDGRIFCTSGITNLDYEARERSSRNWKIAPWAAGPGGCAPGEIAANMMPAGDYTMATCHRVYLTFFPPVQHCWATVSFTVVDPANPPAFIQRSLEPLQEQLEQLKEK